MTSICICSTHQSPHDLHVDLYLNPRPLHPQAEDLITEPLGRSSMHPPCHLNQCHHMLEKWGISVCLKLKQFWLQKLPFSGNRGIIYFQPLEGASCNATTKSNAHKEDSFDISPFEHAYFAQHKQRQGYAASNSAYFAIYMLIKERIAF